MEADARNHAPRTPSAVNRLHEAPLSFEANAMPIIKMETFSPSVYDSYYNNSLQSKRTQSSKCCV